MSSAILTSRPLWLIFLATACLHFLGNWSLPLIDRDEPRFAEASREMLERGDFIVPYFNNEYRFDKPPLTYWLQTASYRVFGQNEAAARLPSVLAAAALAVVLVVWGGRMFDPATGWRAAVIFSLSLQVVMHARAAVADMLMVLFVTLGVWAGWEMARTEKARTPASGWWWLFFVSFALGFLAKGPIAWLPLVPCGLLLARAEGKKHWPLWIAGLVLMLGLVAAWGIPALQMTDGKFLKVGLGKHVVARSVSHMEGHGLAGLGGYLATLPFYFLTVWLSFAPWSFRLPALWKSLPNLRRERDTGYLLLQILLIFGVFTLVKTKLPHYTLPAFPFLALLVARGIDATRFRQVALGMTVFVVVLTLAVFPWVRPLFPAPALVAMSREALRPGMEFASDEFKEPSLVWYFREHVWGFYSPKISPPKAARYMEKKGARFYILPTAEFAGAFPTPDPAWKIFRHQGWNVAKGERVDLTLVVKTE